MTPSEIAAGLSAEGETVTFEWYPFAVPFIHRQIVRMIDNGKDVTPPVDHDRNRHAVADANAYNASMAARYGGPAPVYVYDPDTCAAALKETT